MGFLASGILGGVSSILGGIFGKSAAEEAAQRQAQAAQAAAQGQQQAGNQATDLITKQLANEASVAQPYTSLGSATSKELLNALAPGGTLSTGWNRTFSAPTAAEAAEMPGYQFSLQQGMNALQNSAAARGGLLSTGTAKNLTNYAEGLASTNYQNLFNNALQAYNTNFNTWNTSNNALFNRLYGAIGLGENAANSLNALQSQGTLGLSSDLLGNAQTVGNDLMQSANARAAGIIGGNNALWGGLSGGLNNIAQGISLQRLLGARNASNANTSIPEFSAGYTPPEAIINYAGGS